MRFYLPILTVSAPLCFRRDQCQEEKSRVGVVESAMAMMLEAPSTTIFPAQNEQFVMRVLKFVTKAHCSGGPIKHFHFKAQSIFYYPIILLAYKDHKKDYSVPLISPCQIKSMMVRGGPSWDMF